MFLVPFDRPSFSPYKPLQNVDFSKVGNMQFFFQELYSHIDKNSGEKFEDMFLVKIAIKGTSLNPGSDLMEFPAIVSSCFHEYSEYTFCETNCNISTY